MQSICFSAGNFLASSSPFSSSIFPSCSIIRTSSFLVPSKVPRDFQNFRVTRFDDCFYYTRFSSPRQDPANIPSYRFISNLKNSNLVEAEVKRPVFDQKRDYPGAISGCGADSLRTGLLAYMQLFTWMFRV